MNDHNPTPKYIVITPVRNEELYIRETIASVLSQTILPLEWVIVDDGSTDRTAEILEKCAGEYPWIHVIHRPDRGSRESGSGVMEAVADGYASLVRRDWEFLVKLDGDLTFPEDYFEKCFEHFHRDSQLGIGGGTIYHRLKGKPKAEKTPAFHVRGATKIYKRECWEAIGGLWLHSGWDTIDEVNANMLGWKTQSFANLRVLHHRFTGSANGFFRDTVKHGTICYITGYHPLFLAASCVRRLTDRPYILGSAAVFYGFVKSHFTNTSRVQNKHLIHYVRQQQLRRLMGLQTIWR